MNRRKGHTARQGPENLAGARGNSDYMLLLNSLDKNPTVEYIVAPDVLPAVGHQPFSVSELVAGSAPSGDGEIINSILNRVAASSFAQNFRYSLFRVETGLVEPCAKPDMAGLKKLTETRQI